MRAFKPEELAEVWCRLSRGTYLAGRYDRRQELATIAEHLAQYGVTVTSRWLLGVHESEGVEIAQDQSLHGSTEEIERFASEDLADLEKAEVVLHFTETPEVGYNRGGRHVEFGYALAMGKQNVVIGPPESVFHYLGEGDGVFHYPTVDDFIAFLAPTRQ